MKNEISFEPFCYSVRHYLTHPWKWFRDLKTYIANKRHRAKCGWAWIDLWNMDHYLTAVIPNMLNELADRSAGAPYGVFEDSRWLEFDDWANELRVLADLIDILHYDPACEEERFIEDYDKWRSGELLKPIEGLKFYDEYKFPADGEERLAKATARYVNLHEKREILMDVVFARLRGVWDTLWD